MTLNVKGNPRVFVYGTLKRGHSNHGLLEQYNFLGRAYIEGPYKMSSIGTFPGVTDGHEGPARRIYGEVYVVDDEGLASLDLLEGHPDFYERKKVRTNVEEYGNVWCYFFNGEHREDRDVPSGMWYPYDEEAEAWKEEASATAA